MRPTSRQFANWQEALAFCVQLHEAGRLSEAEEGYRQLAALKPEQPDVSRLLGLVLAQMQRAGEGLPHLQRAVRLAPKNPLAHLHLGYVLKSMGRDEQAIVYFERAKHLAPRDPSAWINLAALYTESGNLSLAIDAARQAIRLGPDQPEAYHNLGFALLEAGQLGEALGALQHAVRLKPAFPEAWMHLGRTYHDLGYVEEATAAYGECLRLQADHVGAAVNLANIWLRRGYHPEAIDLYRQVLSREPGRWEAKLSLVAALAEEERFTEALSLIEEVTPPRDRERQVYFQRLNLIARADRQDEARQLLKAETHQDLQYWLTAMTLAESDTERLQCVIQIENHLEDPSAADEVRHTAAFSLGDDAHERGDYAQAFEFYRRGHVWLRARERYDHSAWERETKRLIDLFEHWQDQPFSMVDEAGTPKPIFIVGMPRSGTSLLEQILDNHSQIVGAGELVHWGQMAAGTRIRGVDPDRLTAECRAYLSYLRKLGREARYVTDKMPHNFQYLGLIALLLPQARIIHCCRDPRDNALSIWRQRFLGNHAYAHDLQDLAKHFLAHDEVMAHWRARVPNPILTVDYESVVADLAGQVQRMMDFLDLPFEARCLEFHTNVRKVRTASREQVTRPLYNTSVGLWRHYADQLQPFTNLVRSSQRFPF